MKYNQWTLALASVGMVSLAAVARADETTPVMTALSSTVISGYVDTSAQWNFGTGNANNPNYAFGGAGKADGFNLNVVKLTIAKDADATNGWAAGYKVDLLFGPDADAFATTSKGAGFATSDFGIKQAYVDLKAPIGNGLDIKVGVWDTIIGYEVFDASSNPNFTRSYGYSIEPTTHTGVLATYQFSDMFSASAGVADTFGATINQRATPPTGTYAESYKTYMGDIALTAPKDWGFLAGSTLYGCIINGFNGGPNAQTSVYGGISLNTPLKALKVGAAYDYVLHKEIVDSAIGSYASAIGVYATYQLTEKLSLNGRGEYFYQSVNAIEPLPGKVFEATATLQYDLWKNVVSRAEFRWDHSADGLAAYGGQVAGLPDRINSFELIGNVAYKF